MKDKLRDLFTFSSGERKGIIALVFILIVICGLNMFLLSHQSTPVQNKYPDWMNDTGAFEVVENFVFSDNDSYTEHFTADVVNTEPKSFIDPNTASVEDLILTGFSLRIARTILNYREKGGKFRTPGDLKKIYGVTPEIFQAVEPYITIKGLTSTQKPITELPAIININTADSADFEKLPGIGPVLARRIIRYRTLLGGYYSPEQLREVYGVSDSLFRQIGHRLEADTAAIKKINVNTSDEKDMARHPYIGKYVASGILQYRSHVVNILDIKTLRDNGVIPRDRFDKVKYYLSL